MRYFRQRIIYVIENKRFSQGKHIFDVHAKARLQNTTKNNDITGKRTHNEKLFAHRD